MVLFHEWPLLVFIELFHLYIYWGCCERLARKYFEKKGYEIFKGRTILGKEFSINYDVYPNVKDKYDRLEVILLNDVGVLLQTLRSFLITPKGLPDFFIHQKYLKKSFFVEVKLEHEQIKPHQLETMHTLESFGFDIIVLRIKSKVYREECEIELGGDREENLKLKNRKILVRQEKVRVRY